MLSLIKPGLVAVLCGFGLLVSSPARAEILTLLSALVLGSMVIDEIDGSSGDYAKSQPNSELAQSFRSLSLSQRKAVQRQLSNWGYYQRGIDGVWGTGTLAALRRYAADRGLSLNLQSSRDANMLLARLQGGSANSSNFSISTPAFGGTYARASTNATAMGARTRVAPGARLTRSEIARMQLLLSAKGFDAGQADGVFGIQSNRAANGFLGQQGLSLQTVSLAQLYTMLEETAGEFLNSQAGDFQLPASLEAYEDLPFETLSLKLSRHAMSAEADPFEDEAVLLHWIEQEFPAERFGPDAPLANDLTRAFYAGTDAEKQDAIRLLRRLVEVNMNDDPFKFVLRDPVKLQPVNFTAGRGVPIHMAALGDSVFVPYDLNLARIYMTAVKAHAEFHNDTDYNIGYLPVDAGRAEEMDSLLAGNADNFRFEMLSFITLNSLSLLDPAFGKKQAVYEADADFDGFALVVSEVAKDGTTDETLLYLWQGSTAQGQEPAITTQGAENSYFATPTISTISTF